MFRTYACVLRGGGPPGVILRIAAFCCFGSILFPPAVTALTIVDFFVETFFTDIDRLELVVFFFRLIVFLILLRLFVDLDIGATFVIFPLLLICRAIVSDFFGLGFFLIAGFFELF